MRCLFYMKDVKGKEPVMYLAVKGCREALLGCFERLADCLWCEDEEK